MFQLQAIPEPEWRDVAPGIRFKFRFGPTEALGAARRAARAAAKADPKADTYVAFVAGAVIWGVTEWDGIGAEGAEGAAPLTPELMTALLRQRPDIFDDVDEFYISPLMALLSEKKD